MTSNYKDQNDRLSCHFPSTRYTEIRTTFLMKSKVEWLYSCHKAFTVSTSKGFFCKPILSFLLTKNDNSKKTKSSRKNEPRFGKLHFQKKTLTTEEGRQVLGMKYKDLTDEQVNLLIVFTEHICKRIIEHYLSWNLR